MRRRFADGPTGHGHIAGHYRPARQPGPGGLRHRQPCSARPCQNRHTDPRSARRERQHLTDRLRRYDMTAGVEYQIDRSRPEGDRIRNLLWQGKPLAAEQKLRIAINNYRAGGSGGYKMFQGAKPVWRSPEDIRELLIRYYTERKTIPVESTGNWKIVK